MMIGKDSNGEYQEVKVNENGNLAVVVTDGSATSTETTLNASVQTVGTTATSININKKVTTIDIANYSESANVTLTIGTVSYVIGSSVATTLTINKDVTTISLTSTEADTKVQLVIKGINGNTPEPTYELDFNQILVESEGEDAFINKTGQNLIELFESLDAEEVGYIITAIPTDNNTHSFKIQCSDMTIYGDTINISQSEVPAMNLYTNNKNIKVEIETDPDTGDTTVVVTEIND